MSPTVLDPNWHFVFVPGRLSSDHFSTVFKSRAFGALLKELFLHPFQALGDDPFNCSCELLAC